LPNYSCKVTNQLLAFLEAIKILKSMH